VDPQQAESYFLIALSSFERLSAEYPEDTGYRRFIFLSLKSLGPLHFSHGGTVAATDAYRKGCDIMERLVLDFEEVPQFRRERATARISLGRTLALTGKQNEGAAILQQAVDELVELKQKTPDHKRVEYNLIRAYNILARLFSNWMPAESRDQALALEYADKAKAGKKLRADVRTTIGILRYHSGDWTEAKRLLIPQADETDWLFISMCESHLGHPMEAVHWYEKAVGANNNSPLTNLELQRYRRQAEALLDLPADQ